MNMDNYRIPPSAAWYTQAICTPNNGLLYIAGNQSAIAYIPPISLLPQIIHLNHRIKSILCDPNWSKTKWFVTMNEENVINVWDLDTESVVRGHRAHHQPHHRDDADDASKQTMSGQNNSNGGVMCMTQDRQVLSIDRNHFVKYCLLSNTYSMLCSHLIQKPNNVCALKSSPYDSDIVAVGYRNGLILIVDVKRSALLQKLRGHDSEIVSLEWMRITPENAQPIEIPVESCPIDLEQWMPGRDAPKPIVDEGDMFDIFSFDYLEEEFGTISKPVRRKDIEDSKVDADTVVGTGSGIVNKADYNFDEACVSLRHQIVGEHMDIEKKSLPEEECSAVPLSEVDLITAEFAIADGSEGDKEADNDVKESDPANASTRSTIGSTQDVAELADIENELSEMKINVEKSGKIYLASGAQESYVVIWNVEEGSVSDKLILKVQRGKMAIPKPICAVAWYKPSELIANTPNGNISKWSILSDDECKIHKSIELQKEFIEKSVIGICSNATHENVEKYVWTFSMHLKIIGRKIVDGTSELIADLSTLPIGMLSMHECPHDPNRIAIAGNNKRISILNLTTFAPNYIQMQPLTSRIQGKVLAVAWHPQNESDLAFSTNEGRVGVFDMNKPSSPPELMKNFCGKNLYSVSFGRVDDDSVLFACNERKLMMFFRQNYQKITDHSFKKFTHGTTAVSANDEYVAVGLAIGSVKILDRQLKDVWVKSLSKKYISSLAWSSISSPVQLAAASMDEKIHLIQIGSYDTDELIGHQSGVACVKWSNQSATKLVSAGFDGSVRVWDTKKKECIGWHRYDNRMFCAMFLPTDENYVLCSGQSETVHFFDVRQNLVENVGQFKAKNKKKLALWPWATLHQTDVVKMKIQEKKKLKKMGKQLSQSVVVQPTKGEETITNASELVSLETTYKMNFTTIFHLINKEMNKAPLDCLERGLTGGASLQNDESDVGALHSLLFSTREDVQKLLEIELENHKCSKTESIGNLIIPQINFALKESIIDSITAKKLTQQQIALAPSISYEFWRNCCHAYAIQCFEQGLVLQGLPYMLAIHRTTEIIQQLCETHFYREAWIVAKMYKEAEDKEVFQTIAALWIKHLEQTGNLEGAAMIAYMAGRPANSLEILDKRKNPTPQIDHIVKLLIERISQDKPE